MREVIVDGNNLSIEDVVNVGRFGAMIKVPNVNKKKVEDNWNMLLGLLDKGEIMYGVNTGIGGFGNCILSNDLGGELSERMLRAHAAGTGNPAPLEIARAAVLLRLNTLVKGYSGVRLIIINRIVELLNKNIIPVIYEKGSVGTSGDLAPLSQAMLPIIGEGEVIYKGERLETKEVFKKENIEPIRLMPREGLALFNGTQFMSAYACLNIYDTERLIKLSQASGALTIDVLNTVTMAFDKRLMDLRPYKGQRDVAENLLNLIKDSEILAQKKTETQSCYSLRCTPQVTGAFKDALEYTKKQILIEINSVVDNPVFITESETYLAGGNFHGEPVGLVMDLLSIAITDLGNLSERRTNRLLNPNLNGSLPAFLIKSEGLDSGLMIAQYTQAGLINENKILATPATIDSISVSGDQEDHVSMATNASRKLREIIKNTQAIIAIELLCGCQALDFKRPLKAGVGSEIIYEEIRKISKFIDKDRIFYKDIDKVIDIIRNEELLNKLEEKVIFK